MPEYKGLVEKLRKHAARINELARGLFGVKEADLFAEAADAIEELARENKSLAKSVNEASDILRRRWIPVEERLPEINTGPVIVYVPPCEDEDSGDFYHGYVGMAHHIDSANGGFWCGTDGNTYGAIGIIRTPTHWMSLPDPPDHFRDLPKMVDRRKEEET